MATEEKKKRNRDWSGRQAVNPADFVENNSYTIPQGNGYKTNVYLGVDQDGKRVFGNLDTGPEERYNDADFGPSGLSAYDYSDDYDESNYGYWEMPAKKGKKAKAAGQANTATQSQRTGEAAGTAGQVNTATQSQSTGQQTPFKFDAEGMSKQPVNHKFSFVQAGAGTAGQGNTATQSQRTEQGGTGQEGTAGQGGTGTAEQGGTEGQAGAPEVNSDEMPYEQAVLRGEALRAYNNSTAGQADNFRGEPEPEDVAAGLWQKRNLYDSSEMDRLNNTATQSQSTGQAAGTEGQVGAGTEGQGNTATQSQRTGLYDSSESLRQGMEKIANDAMKEFDWSKLGIGTQGGSATQSQSTGQAAGTEGQGGDGTAGQGNNANQTQRTGLGGFQTGQAAMYGGSGYQTGLGGYQTGAGTAGQEVDADGQAAGTDEDDYIPQTWQELVRWEKKKDEEARKEQNKDAWWKLLTRGLVSMSNLIGAEHDGGNIDLNMKDETTEADKAYSRLKEQKADMRNLVLKRIEQNEKQRQYEQTYAMKVQEMQRKIQNDSKAYDVKIQQLEIAKSKAADASEKAKIELEISKAKAEKARVEAENAAALGDAKLDLMQAQAWRARNPQASGGGGGGVDKAARRQVAKSNLIGKAKTLVGTSKARKIKSEGDAIAAINKHIESHSEDGNRGRQILNEYYRQMGVSTRV